MKTITLVLTTVLVIFVMAGPAPAGEAQARACCNDYLTKKIDCCQRTAGLFNACYNSRIYDLIRMRAEQADFYEKNWSELVDIMVSRNLGKKAHQMDYFLLKEFKIRRHLASGSR